ncbi:hypothetical protein GPECTOR_6g641 [Gonium pectorale]|uniref:Protein kinase domain-containing protein n=1 Tax=Gonium pectorale TaxID=33097 RepID=A0A150GVA2_GONPE|nr:hypothetical protein GPECTOR_6g641 [Gonium pectorale]|eukprot:KXZ53724.1 hypothetical protein GPECTOR_6g641 [Gonium pectorale]
MTGPPGGRTTLDLGGLAAPFATTVLLATRGTRDLRQGSVFLTNLTLSGLPTGPAGDLPSTLLRLGMWSFSGLRGGSLHTRNGAASLTNVTVELPPEEVAAWYGSAGLTPPRALLPYWCVADTWERYDVSMVSIGSYESIALQALPASLANFTSCLWTFQFQRASLVDRPAGLPYVLLDSVVLLVPQAELDWLAAVWEHADEIRSWNLSGSPANGADPGRSALPASLANFTSCLWTFQFQRASLVDRPAGLPYVLLDSVVLLVPQAELDWLAAVWEHADEIRSWNLSGSPANGADPGLVSAVRSHLDESRLLHQGSLTGASPDAGAPQEPPQEAPSSVRALVFQAFSWCGLQGRNVSLTASSEAPNVLKYLWPRSPLLLPDLPSGGGSDPRAARALADAAISTSLSHPNIVATYTHTLQPLRDACPEDPLALSTPSPLSSQSPIPASGGSSTGTTGAIFGGAAVWKLTLIQELCDAKSLRHCLQTCVLAAEPSPAVAIAVPGIAAADIALAANAAPAPLPVLPLGVVLALARDVARGMAHLHSRGVVHADLSSANVLLQSRRPPPAQPPERRPSAGGTGGDSGETSAGATVSGVLPTFTALSSDGGGCRYVAKVCDFGLSGRLDPDGSATHLSGPARRSSAYSAPELVRHGRAGPAGDVYSFGVVLWELALGLPLPAALARPEGAAVREWLTAQAALVDMEAATALPPGLLTWPPHVPSGYPALVKTCLREQPGLRPTFGAIVKQLEKMLQRIN